MEYCDYQNCSNSSLPLFEVKLELKNNRIDFTPSFDHDNKNNFLMTVESLVNDILDTTKYIPRISTSELSITNNHIDISVKRNILRPDT